MGTIGANFPLIHAQHSVEEACYPGLDGARSLRAQPAKGRGDADGVTFTQYASPPRRQIWMNSYTHRAPKRGRLRRSPGRS